MANPAWVQSATAANTTFVSTATATFGSSNTSGNMIILTYFVNGNSTPNNVNKPTDTAGNVYYKMGSIGAFYANTGSIDVWIAPNIATQASNAVTVTDSAGGVNSELVCQEWSGVAQTLYTDAVNLANDGGNTGGTLSAQTTYTSQANDLIWCGFGQGWSSSSQPFTVGSGYSNLSTVTDGSEVWAGCQSKVASSAGSNSNALTSSITNADWLIIAVALRPVQAPNNAQLAYVK